MSDFNAENFFMLLVPRGTPLAVVERLNSAARTTLNDPGVVAQLARQGLEAAASSPEEVATYLRAETQRWRPIVAASGMQPE